MTKINHWKVGTAYTKVDPYNIIGNKKPRDAAKLKRMANALLKEAGYKPNGEKK